MVVTGRLVAAMASAGLLMVLTGMTSSSVDADNAGYSSKKLEVEHQTREILKTQPVDAAGPEEAGVKIPAEPAAAAPEPEHFYTDELVEVLSAVGFEGDALARAWAVAMKESTGNPRAHNQNSRTGDNSYGLFQINMIGKMGPARVDKYGLNSYEDLFDPYINARVAFEMSDEGTNWGPWGVGPNAYNGSTKGSYSKWLNEFRRLTNG